MPDWRCPLCDVALKFDSMGHTVDHIQAMHEEQMNEFGISEVLSWYAVRSYGIASCPLCSIKGPKDAPALVEHVVSHAYNFAFRSLLWSRNDLGNPNKPIDSHSSPKDPHEAYGLMEQVQKSPDFIEKAAITKPDTIEQQSTETTRFPIQHGYSKLRSTEESFHDKTIQSSGSKRPSKRPERTSIEQEALHHTKRNPRGLHDFDSGSMDSDSSITGDELVDHLLKELVQSSFDNGKEFWPRGCIEKIVTLEAITEVIGPRLDALLVDFIMKESRTLFTIALCSNLDGDRLLRAMNQFKQLNFNDSSLPIVGDDVKRIFISPTGKGFKYPWNGLSVRNFRSYQWKSLAPAFDTKNRSLKLHPKAVLPFTRTSRHGSSGTFGEVHKVTIHPMHRKNGISVRLFSIFKGFISL